MADTSIPLQASPKVRYQQGCAQPKCTTPSPVKQYYCPREKVYYCEEHHAKHDCSPAKVLPFQRLVREVAKDFKSDLHFQADAVAAEVRKDGLSSCCEATAIYSSINANHYCQKCSGLLLNICKDPMCDMCVFPMCGPKP